MTTDRSNLLSAVTAFILIYLAWIWGGLHQVSFLVAVGAAGILLIGVLLAAVIPGNAPSHGGQPWWRDLFFYAGLAFLTYLAIQWWNAGRIMFFDVGLSEWRYSLPRHPGWPSAFMREEAAQMLTWFFPAWVLGLAVRSPTIGARKVRSIIRVIVYSAGLLSLVGIVQFVTQSKARYWIRPATDPFFASFGYTNHAAAFFVLSGALAAGLLYREVFRAQRVKFKLGEVQVPVDHGLNGARSKRRTLRIMSMAACLLLCLVGANLSLSRAGVILAWALAGFAALYGLIRGWRKVGPVARVNLAAVTFATLCIFYFAVAGFGEKAIRNEFRATRPIHHRMFPILDNVNLYLSCRPLLDQVALEIWQDNRAFGVGGWGYRHLLAFYGPEEGRAALVENPGMANVHCDPLQFLTEFGTVGVGLMGIALLALIVPLFRRHKASAVATDRNRAGELQHNPLMTMSLIGLILIVIFSLIDLPFRCPAILCTWVVVLAGMNKVSREE